MMKLKLAKNIKRKPDEIKKEDPRIKLMMGKKINLLQKQVIKTKLKLFEDNQENNPFYDMIKLKNEAVFKESRIQIFKMLAMSSIKQMWMKILFLIQKWNT